jgi:cholesterol transport system auxiliary component
MVQAVNATTALALTLAVGLLGLGCGGGERIRDIYFTLNSQLAVSPGSNPIPGTLRVSPLAARGFVGGSRIVYRTAEQPLQVQRYNELLWEEVPARALADDILAALRAGKAFESVITAADPARADYLLTGELARFDHLPTGWPPGAPTGPSTARASALPPGVSIEFALALVDGRSRRLLVSKTYSGFEPTPTDAAGRTTPEAMIDAFNRLSGRLIGELLRDIQTEPSARR